MASRRYLNFDLLLEQEADGQFRARVTASPLPDQPGVRFMLPFDETKLENLLLKLDPGRTGFRGESDDQQKAAKEFGGPLFEAIFTGALATAWTLSLRVAADQSSGLRLRLRLDDAADLVGLPWELLYDEKVNAFPAQSEITPLVRFLNVANETAPIEVNGPLRMLAIISSPVDLEELDVEREWRGIEKAMEAKIREGLVVVDRLPEPTVDALGEWLLTHETHVIHFVGHGSFSAASGEGSIYFQNEHGNKDPVSAAILGPFVHDHQALRMVVVNACRAGRTSPKDPYGGMAQGLVQQGATAVVAMQFPISDPAAILFTSKFYGALAAGLPVDQAVSYARKVLQAKFRSEWATPVLFMRSPDGNIFQGVQTPADWVWHQPPDSDPTGPDITDPVLADLDAGDLDAADLDVTDLGATDFGPTDPEVTDVGATDPDVTGPPPEARPRKPLQPGPDPYQFLFEPESPDTTDAGGGAPGVAGWVRAHARLLVVAAGVLGVVIVGVLVALRLLGGGLPAGEPLADSQMLVAAGDDFQHLNIYLIDVDDAAQQERLTQDDKSLLPVLSPDRRSMLYVRRLDDSKDFELRAAAAIDGTGDRALELPPECRTNASRPAWIPGTEDLVLRCEEDAVARLVRVDLHGHLVKVLLTLGSRAPFGLTWVGDPTVSGDGRTVVFFGRGDESRVPDGGSLYLLDLAETTPQLLLAESSEGEFGFSDPVFSQQEQGEEWLAWRAGDQREGVINFEVFAAPYADGRLGEPVLISDPTSVAREQDPMFSPSGASIVYGRQAYQQPDAQGSRQLSDAQALWLAPIDAPQDRELISAADPQFWGVPAWSGR